MSKDTAVTASAVVAVIAVNIVSFGYVYYAYCVEEDPEPAVGSPRNTKATSKGRDGVKKE